MRTVKKIFLGVVLSLALVVNLGGICANAMESTEEQADIFGIDVYETDDVVPYTSEVSLYYNATAGGHYLGKFTASSSIVQLKFWAPNVGRAAIYFRTGSKTGPIHKTIITPAAGETSATLTSTFSVTRGTTYYIIVKPYGDFVQTKGHLEITY